ncbi:LysR family transcriptional regulator [Ideonella sp.]|jgi:DNA-binding transcriptional LysR family regulator|uniref:LysR family transcriptional regulator n=1 Tax=Ideonella sp. TaxID=1929293 RepID=UPI0037BFF900
MNKFTALDDMALFVAVAKAGSLNRASTQTGVPLATLSRRLAQMEQRLGVRLFERTARSLNLTPPAQRFLERCEPVVAQALLAEEALRETAELPLGHVRVTMPVDFGQFWIAPLVPEFLSRFPGISLDLDLSAQVVDLRAEGFDVALRLGTVRGEQLVARRLGSLGMALFAAPAYLARASKLKHPSDLARHSALVLGSAQGATRWRLSQAKEVVDVQVRGALGLNNIGMVQRLAEQGLGVAMLPPLQVRDSLQSGRLEPVLPAWKAPSLPVQAVTTTRLVSAAVRAWLDFLAQRLSLD